MSRVPRVYLPPAAFVEGAVRPSREAGHHLFRVLRLRPGERWAALDGQGRSWLCEVGDEAESSKVEEWAAVPPLPLSVEVGLALCKGQRFEDALEKMAELGVRRLVPLRTERTERGLPSSAKSERWEQIAKSASALANRLIPLEVGAPQDLDQFLAHADPACTVYCHHDGASPGEVFGRPRDRLTLAIGPEGGFSPPELMKLQSVGQGVSLGPLTLRVETAAVVATSLALALPEACLTRERSAPGQ